MLALSRSSINGHHDYFYIFEHSCTSNTATPLVCPILFFLAAPHCMWDLSSPIRDGTPAPAMGAWSLSHRTESPCKHFPCVCLIGFCCLCRVTSGILAPWPRTEPRLFALKAPCPNHWTIREFPPIVNPYLKIDRPVVPTCLESQLKMGVHMLNKQALEELDLEWGWHQVRKANKFNQMSKLPALSLYWRS